MFSSCQDQSGDFWVMPVCFTWGGAFWYVSIWYIGRPIFQYCRVCSNVLIFFLDFVSFFADFWCFPVARTKVGIFEWCRYVFLGGAFWCASIWYIGRPIFQYCRVCSNVLIFFLNFVGFFCRLLMFSSCQDQSGDFWVILVCFTLGGAFWYASIWYIGRPIFQYCRGLL